MEIFGERVQAVRRFLFFFGSGRLSCRLDAQADAQPHFWGGEGRCGIGDLRVWTWMGDGGCKEARRVFVVFWHMGRVDRLQWKMGIDFWTTRSFFR